MWGVKWVLLTNSLFQDTCIEREHFLRKLLNSVRRLIIQRIVMLDRWSDIKKYNSYYRVVFEHFSELLQIFTTETGYKDSVDRSSRLHCVFKHSVLMTTPFGKPRLMSGRSTNFSTKIIGYNLRIGSFWRWTVQMSESKILVNGNYKIWSTNDHFIKC